MLSRRGAGAGLVVALAALSILPVAAAPPAAALCLGSAPELCPASTLTLAAVVDGTGAGVVATAGTTGGVAGVSLGNTLANGAAAAAVSVLGWQAGEVVIGDAEAGTGAAGLDLGPPPGWSGMPVHSQYYGPGGFGQGTWTWTVTDVEQNYPTGVQVTVATTGPFQQYGYGGLEMHCRWKDPASPYAGSWPTTKFGPTFGHAGSTSWPSGSAQLWCPHGDQVFDHVVFVAGAGGMFQEYRPEIWGVPVTWYPPGDARRPEYAPGSGSITRHLQCVGADGATTHLSDAVPADAGVPATIGVEALTCPPGMVASAFSSTWTPQGGSPQVLTPHTSTPQWVRDIPQQYPDCVGQLCLVQLHRLDPAQSCGPLGADCPTWYIDPDRATSYTCTWGPYTVALDHCSVYREPGRLTPNAFIDSHGTTQYIPWPALDLESGPVATLRSRLVNRYGLDHGCAVLGEKLRPLAPDLSIPDVVIVCRAHGVQTALRFASRTSGSPGTDGVFTALLDAPYGPEPPVLDPDCMYSDLDEPGCVDEGAPSEEPTAEPEPEPAGAGIKPPPSCIEDPWVRGLLVESMPEQYHHMATKYGDWAKRFQEIAGPYGLSINDSAKAWNLVRIPHRGPHPAGYHQWVLDNMLEADRVANGDVVEFKRLFTAWVVDVVKNDPSIVRHSYWNCEKYRD